MAKLSQEKLVELIYGEEECRYIDFKMTQYTKEKKLELIKDMISMANSEYKGDKYIIVGVKNIPGNKNKIIGINEKVEDDSNYQQLISENIEPEIRFSYYYDTIEDKIVTYFIIYSDNLDKPYMMKKDYNKLKTGDAFKRVGSSQKRLTRNDYDDMYIKKSSMNNEINSKIEAINFEINFLHMLKKYDNYLIYKNNTIVNLIQSYLNCINIPRWSIRNIPSNISEVQWKYNTLVDISGFSISNMDIKIDENVLKKINANHFDQYSNIINNLKEDYEYLKNIQDELKQVKNLDWGFKDFEVRNFMNKIYTKTIYSNFTIKNDYYMNFSFMNLLNYEERISELESKVNELELMINR